MTMYRRVSNSSNYTINNNSSNNNCNGSNIIITRSTVHSPVVLMMDIMFDDI